MHKAEVVTIKTGHKVLFIETKAESVYLSTVLRAGYRFIDDEAKFEVPHLVEHLAFEGNTKYKDPKKFLLAIENTGSRYNASTGQDFVRYYYETFPEYALDTLDTMLHQVFEPLVAKKRIEQQKNVIVQELKAKADKDEVLLKVTHSLLQFRRGVKQYSERAELATALSKEDLQTYYRTLHCQENALFIVSGNVSTLRGQVVGSLENYLAKTAKLHNMPSLEPWLSGPQTAWAEGKTPNRVRFIFNYTDYAYQPDDHIALRLAAGVLGVGLGSRIKYKSREAGLSYYFSATYLGSHESTGLSFSDMNTPDKTIPMLDLITTEIKNVKSGDITGDELHHAKQIWLGAIRRGMENPLSLPGWYMSDFVWGDPLIKPADYIEKVKNTTKKDVVNVLKKYVRPDSARLTIVGHNQEELMESYLNIVKNV